MDELKCNICNELFNETVKIPRLLVSCGHSYCQECLSVPLLKKQQIQCPEDKTSYNVLNVEDLPKNISLLRILSKKKVERARRSQTFNNSM